ncbi:hypothetical protein R5M92_16155 (plasmid) [Halomonas sp. Bachu 37]|uniref:hypothetical protein n=1 Tax=Halomonas kashgarensis TaxID=3084920 RepID=UPI003216E8ED
MAQRTTEQLLAEAEAKAAKLRKRQRRERDRRLLLTGIAFEAWAADQSSDSSTDRQKAVADILDKYIVAERDRKFLGLKTAEDSSS